MKRKALIWLSGILLAGLGNTFAQPVITTQPQPQTVPVGATVTFTVGATGTEPLSYQWYFNSPGNPMEGATSSSLVLSNVQESDDGFYRVNVANGEGSVWSASGRLTVLLPPSITTQPINQTGRLDGRVTFSVSVSGATPFFYQWRFNETELVGETNSTLALTELQLSHLGSYTVVITNISGSRTSDRAGLSLLTTVRPPFEPGLSIGWEEEALIVRWAGEGELEEAPFPNGPWSPVTVTESTATIQPTNSGAFFRVRNPTPRPVDVFLPSSYDPETPLPLIVLLHGYTASSTWIENYMRLQPLAESRGFLYCKPERTREPDNDRFWNATDACCNFVGSRVDDVAYLSGLIDEIIRTWGADPGRIHLIGHSNGGFMSYRMACDRAWQIASIASLAGATWLVSNDCQPSEPVHILQIHGTADGVISYNRGTFLTGAIHPGAMETIGIWAGYNGCEDLETETVPTMDLDLARAGLDTRVTRYNSHPAGGAVELWTIDGGSHGPTFFSGSEASDFSPRVVDWLLAHPKPQP